tara:strand:+ start:1345 stop:1779 length:435 start_codon:yes stop_codon:yes gene_type:complete
MPVTFTNNWKNILDKLQSVLRTEFGGSLTVYRGMQKTTGNQYLRLVPLSSELSEYNINSETREFTIQVLYYFFEKNMRETALDHVMRMTSRIEALIHDNITMTLADSTNVFNCRFESTNLNADEDEEAYVVEWEWKGQHLGNAA